MGGRGALRRAGGIGLARLLHHRPHPRGHWLRKIGIDIIHRKAMAAAKRSGRILRPVETVGGVRIDAPLEEVEIGDGAGFGRAPRGRLAERLDRVRGQVGPERFRADRQAIRTAARALRWQARVGFLERGLVHNHSDFKVTLGRRTYFPLTRFDPPLIPAIPTTTSASARSLPRTTARQTRSGSCFRTDPSVPMIGETPALSCSIDTMEQILNANTEVRERRDQLPSDTHFATPVSQSH